jgi:hypothetical protein
MSGVYQRKKGKNMLLECGGAANNSQFSPLHTQFPKSVVFIPFFAANHCNDRSLLQLKQH